MPTTIKTETQELNTEERILAAAEREFILKGYDGARTTAIAEAAGVTHAMLHYYFRTKDNLFDRIIDSKIGTIRDIMLGSLDDPAKPLLDRITAAIEQHIDFIAANPDLPKFMINEVFSRPDRLPVVLDRLSHHASLMLDSLQRQIDEYAARGLCRKANAIMLILDIVSLNIFPFMAAPMANPLLGGIMDDVRAFTEARKKENIETIMNKLRP